MAKKKKSANPSIPETQNSAPVFGAEADAETKAAQADAAETGPVEQASMEDEITLSPDTIEEIGEPDKELVFKNIARAYEEAKRKREKYKKIGPIFVLVSGIIFLALIFTLENKITFLIFWVITILYTVALMIRTEYKYHLFRRYLGLTDEETDEEENAQTQTAESQSNESAEAETPKTASSKNQQEEKE